MLISKNWRFVASLFILLSTSIVYGGTFTPDAGTTITSAKVTVAWSSDGDQQWVRAYGSTGSKIYDSGRQQTTHGSVQFTIPDAETRLRVIYYEKTGSTWHPDERTYSVDISDHGGNGDGGNSAGATLAGLNCSTNQIAKYDGSVWICAEDETSDASMVVDSLQSIFCSDDEEITRNSEGFIRCEAATASCAIKDLLEIYSLTADQGAAGTIVDTGIDGLETCSVSNETHNASFTYSLVPPLYDEKGLYGAINSNDGIFFQDLDYPATPAEVQACATLVGCGELTSLAD